MHEKYDVFLSFRGEDTRNTFTSHLYAALLQKKTETYIDNMRLERGDKIAPALLEAIDKSKLSVIIFSKSYASSTWCLDELVHILECNERDGQVVIPIFYDIDPSHVGKQQGSYADAFAKLEERFKDNMDKVHKWRVALRKAAKISGFDNSNKTGLESDLVKTVVKDILTKLNRKTSSDLKGLVGIESRIEEIETLLCIDSLDACINVAIWGMGGIGKTTLADVVFHRLSSKFEACCFLANVREKSEEKDGLIQLRNTLLRKILDDENINIDTPSVGSKFVKKRLGRTKVLIVLDDVNHSNQLKLLAHGDHVRFGPGSRIIITTRDKSLLKKVVEDDKIYKVKALKREEALQLFHLNALKNNTPITDYTELVEKVVDHAGGIPLALQILGTSFLHCESKEDWIDQLINLKESLSGKMQKVLRLSYDDLEENKKEIFLDIACFDKVETRYMVKRMLDAGGVRVAEIRVLGDKSLISISESMLIEMHDLQKEMGRTIIREQCIEEPGKRSRLFIAEDVYHVLKNNTGTAAVEVIVFSMSEIEQLHLNLADFKKMYNLRLLNMDNSTFGNYSELKLSLPNSLTYLSWVGYQLKSLPSEFSAENLVELRMSNSKVEKLWNASQNLKNLKVMDLSYSRHLTEVPDLSHSHKIKDINLHCCTSLVQIPSYFKHFDKLTHLNLGACSNLKFLSEMPCNIKCLDLSSTAIKKLPASVWSNEKISTLDIRWCKDLKKLPKNSCKLKLCNLSLWGCSSLGKVSEFPSNITELELIETAVSALPSSIECLSRLKKIVLVNCKRLVSLPTSICKLNSLEKLNLTGCSKFEYFPKILETMEHLTFLSLSETMVKELPKSIENLTGLQTLQLYQCKNLRFLPNSIYNLNNLRTLKLGGCLKLKKLPAFSVGLCSLEKLNFSYCGILKIPDGLICLTSLRDLDLRGTMIQSIPASIKQASQLSALRVTDCKRLQSLPELPKLQILEAHGCTSLVRVSNSCSALIQGSVGYKFSRGHLEEINFSNCLKLKLNERSNIMAEARLRIMLNAMASSKLKEEGGHVRCSPLTVVCPGKEIPNWFSYKNGGSSISIKFPPDWFNTNFLGFALSLVVAFNKYNVQGKLAFGCTSNFKTNNGESREFKCRFHCGETNYENRNGFNFNSNHVFVWYNNFDLVGGAECSTPFANVIAEASHKFYLTNSDDRPVSSPKVKVKKCGIHLLYAQDVEKFDVMSDGLKGKEDT